MGLPGVASQELVQSSGREALPAVSVRVVARIVADVTFAESRVPWLAARAPNGAFSSLFPLRDPVLGTADMTDRRASKRRAVTQNQLDAGSELLLADGSSLGVRTRVLYDMQSWNGASDASGTLIIAPGWSRA